LNQDYNARDANCHYVGDYCTLKLPFVGCVQKKKTFCCFSSPLARIIHEQGRPQLGIDWGGPKSPNCRGFTIDEFQKLDFSKIDFSEWVNMIVNGGLQQIQSQMGNTINNVIKNIRNSY
jgi:conjugal transfer mating pair stabilization protein TraN